MNSAMRIEGPEGQSFWSADRWRVLVPLLTSLAALLLMTLPLVTPGPIFPNLALLAVLVWSLFQPSLMPPYIAFGIGLLTDIVLGTSLGVHACLMPTLVIVVGWLERRFGNRSYFLDWLVAAGLILAYQYFAWHLYGFTTDAGPFTPVLGQVATTILCYPLAVMIIVRFQRRWGETL